MNYYYYFINIWRKKVLNACSIKIILFGFLLEKSFKNFTKLKQEQFVKCHANKFYKTSSIFSLLQKIENCSFLKIINNSLNNKLGLQNPKSTRYDQKIMRDWGWKWWDDFCKIMAQYFGITQHLVCRVCKQRLTIKDCV